MRTVGQILKETRESKLYTLEHVEKATKIRRELLEALENDDYEKLPPPTFVQGFIKNYARFLNLDSNKLLAVFRREFSDKKYPSYVMDAFSQPLKNPRIQITPAKVLGGVVIVAILAFFVYLWIQYRQFTGAPQLAVNSPKDQLTTDNPRVEVDGKTDPQIKVSVNNQQIPVSDSGEFKEAIQLSQQVNKISVEAVNKFGQKTTVERTVYLKR